VPRVLAIMLVGVWLAREGRQSDQSSGATWDWVLRRFGMMPGGKAALLGAGLGIAGQVLFGSDGNQQVGKAYHPEQKRDEHGRWTSGGGSQERVQRVRSAKQRGQGVLGDVADLTARVGN
jgi:hypothetical protein